MSRKIISTVLVLIILVSGITLVISKNQEGIKLSSEETTELANLVNEYYKSLEENDYNKTVSFIYLSKEGDGEIYISQDERIKVLENMMKSYYTKFELGTKCNKERIYFDKQENMAATYVDIIVEDNSGKKESLNEVIFFKRIDNTWKIYKIKSSDDVLLPYRTHSFEISQTTESQEDQI